MARRALTAFFISLIILAAAFANDAQAAAGDACNAKFMDAKGNLRPDKAYAFLMHQQFDIYRKADKNCDGYLRSGGDTSI